MHNRTMLALIGLALAASGCAHRPGPTVPAPPPLAGGWQAADPADEDVRAAADYAARLVPAGHGALNRIDQAEQQVVAGTNYRLVLAFADGQRWRATVWQRLDGHFALIEAEPLPAPDRRRR